MKKVSTYQINKVSKEIILSLEEFMDNCSVPLAKSMVKFWLCTSPNPIMNKARTACINPPKKAVEAADVMSKRLHSPELINLVKLYGTEAEFKVMYKVYAHFYKDAYGTCGTKASWQDGCIFGGGFLYDILKAKATGKNIKMSWPG